MKNNKGFTLVELVVVIAIMAIMAAVSTYSIRTISKQELKNFTNSLDAMLSQCKVETVSGMRDPVLTVKSDRDGYTASLTKTENYRFGTRTVEVKNQKLGKDSLDVYYVYYFNNIRVERSASEMGDISFTFDKSTGEMTARLGYGEIAISELIVKDAKGTAYSIAFIPETGYHKIVR